jgi:sarcosine oxidase
MIGPPEGELVQGARRSAVEHGLPYQWLTPGDIRREFPVFQVPDDAVGLLEPRAGFLDPEGCVAACLELAERHGAAVRVGATVAGWRGQAGGIELTTDTGTVSCGTLVLAAGPWLPELIGGSTLPLSVERQVLYWFEPRAQPERFQPQECPVFLWEWEPGRLFYGFPDHGHGFKVALHHEGRVTSPDTVDRVVSPEEIGAMRALLERTIPDAAGPLRETAVCLYTNTPDHHFVLGRHPTDPGVMLVSPCSGHGFKFASAIGEVVADLVTTGATAYDLRAFAPDRFTASGKS